MTLLEVNDLHAYYGKGHVLQGISLAAGDGEIVAVLGRNGAGKTTTLRAIMGLLRTVRGEICLFGRPVMGWPTYRIAAAGVGYVPEGRRVFGNLSVEENLMVPAARPGPWSLPRVLALFPPLRERRGQLAMRLSGGEQEMLAIARALLLNPRLLLLDEPSQGLAPRVVGEVMAMIRRLGEEGFAIVLVEQNARAAVSVAARVYVLDNGKVLHEGSAAELAREADWLKALAGASA